MRQKHQTSYIASIALPLLFSSASQAATLLWSDSFNQADSLNIRDLTGTPSTRQTFAAGSNLTSPMGFLTNAVTPTQPTNYHEQIQGNRLLQAGDTSIGTFNADPTTSTFGVSLVALNNNFNMTTTVGFADGVVAQCGQLSLIMDPSREAAAGRYSYAGISLGSSGLATTQSSIAGFGVRFVEDGQFGNGNFIQLSDGVTILQNLVVNPAAGGPMLVDLYFSDADSNPWNGVGGTTISVFVNGSQIGSTFTKGDGGYSNNYITTEQSMDFVGSSIMTGTIDNISIFAVPEPSTALLGGLGVLAMLRRRRN